MDVTSPDGYRVRRAERGDAGAYARLRSRMTESGPIGHLGIRMDFHDPRRATYLAEAGDRAVGFGDVKHLDRAWLDGTYVEPGHRSTGLFTALAAERLDDTDADRYVTDAATAHTTTQHRYRGHGFEPVGVVTHPDGPKIRMARADTDADPAYPRLHVPQDLAGFIGDRLAAVFDDDAFSLVLGGDGGLTLDSRTGDARVDYEIVAGEKPPGTIVRELDRATPAPERRTVTARIDLGAPGTPALVDELERTDYRVTGIDLPYGGGADRPTLLVESDVEGTATVETTAPTRKMLDGIDLPYDVLAADEPRDGVDRLMLFR